MSKIETRTTNGSWITFNGPSEVDERCLLDLNERPPLDFSKAVREPVDLAQLGRRAGTLVLALATAYGAGNSYESRQEAAAEHAAANYNI